MNYFTTKIIGSVFAALFIVLLISSVQAQETKFRDQAWRYGLNVGFNRNSSSLGWQELHTPYPNFAKPDKGNMDNVNGKGYGLYGGLFLEYLSESWWGVQIRGSYDTRNALVQDPYTMYNTPPTPHTEFDTKMSYLSLEPAIRIDQHVIPGLSFTAGPLLAANIHGTYDYKPDVNGPVTETNVKVPDRPVASLGLTAGVAYDIELNRSRNTSFYASPFFDYSWMAGQRKAVLASGQNSSSDVWSTQTFRVGVRLSWESRNAVEDKVSETAPPPPPVRKIVAPPASKMASAIMPVDNTIRTKNINGYFPIHPYVFMTKGDHNIPSRYIMLTKTDAQKFNESDLGNFVTGTMTVKETNVDQLMETYYNVMNIYADRMRKNPNERLILRCSDPDEQPDMACANLVKNYFVDIFGINPDRITIVTEPPRKPSGSAQTDPAFSSLIDDENRRVAFVFANDDMYKPVSYTIRDESSIDNDIAFAISDDVRFASWKINISGENESMNYGPFVLNRERINPAPLMRGRTEGNFTARVVITMQGGEQITEDLEFRLQKEKEVRNASRYLMIFDYDKSDPVLSYETKMRKEITPSLIAGNTVIIHGHTDIIGNEAGNQKLSQERANQGKRIVDDELGKENKKVNVQAIGIGQTNMQYTFDNKNPEGRMYNRNVFVEVIQ